MSKSHTLLLLLLLVVHCFQACYPLGTEQNTVMLGKTEYMFREGQAEKFVEVLMVGSPAEEEFNLVYSLDNIFLGGVGGESGLLVVRFPAGASSIMLPVDFADNDKACEDDVVGDIQLMNSSIVRTVKPFRATITIRDDDPARIGFSTDSLRYQEDEGSDSREQLRISVSNAKIDRSITVRITSEHVSTGPLRQSISPISAMVTLTPNRPSVPVPITITNDVTALEEEEEVRVTFSVVSDRCSSVERGPNSTAQITVTDNDVAVVELKEERVRVGEDRGWVELCAELKSEIARGAPVTLQTEAGTAEEGVDYTNVEPTRMLIPFKVPQDLCFNISIAEDGVVEGNETFTASLVPNSQRDDGGEYSGLLVEGATTAVTITDTSHCTSVTLTSQSSQPAQEDDHDGRIVYVQHQISLCFTCPFTDTDNNDDRNTEAAGREVVWLVGGAEVAQDNRRAEILPNGDLLVLNSTTAFDFCSPVRLECQYRGRGGGQVLDPSGQNMTSHSFLILLGAAPTVEYLSYTRDLESLDKEKVDVHVYCVFTGKPDPSVTWQFKKEPIRSDFVTTVNYTSEVFIPEASLDYNGMYTCTVENVLGKTSESIQVQFPPTSAVVNSAATVAGLNMWRTCVMIMLAIVMMFVK